MIRWDREACIGTTQRPLSASSIASGRTATVGVARIRWWRGREGAAELVGDLGGEVVKNIADRDFVAEFAGEAGDGFVGDATGDDEVKWGEVVVDVEGEAVVGDPAGDAGAEGADFAVGGDAMVGVGAAEPDAGVGVEAGGFDVIGGEGVDHGLFEGADVFADVFAVGAKVDDGIGDGLARAVVGGVAAAVGFDEVDASGGILLGGEVEVGSVAVAADGDDGVVFEEEEGVFDGARLALFGEFALQRPGLAVGEAAEVAYLEEAGWHGVGWQSGGWQGHRVHMVDSSNDSSVALRWLMNWSATAPSMMRWSKPRVR